MNQSLHSNYTAHQRNFESVREGEARALLSCAAKLETVRDPEASREALGEAIRHNQKLWTLFQVGLCEETNPLPDETKYILLNLSQYIDKVSFRILAENNRNLIRSLVSINRTIAKGLSENNAVREEPPSAQKEAAPTGPAKSVSSVMTSA
jgi:flagellar protein FlaF